SLPPVASDDDGCEDGNGGSEVAFPATAGVAYAIAIDGYSGATGDGTIAVDLEQGSAAPDNDDFAHAEVLEGASLETEADNLGATSEPGEPAHAGSPAGASLWYEWTAPED